MPKLADLLVDFGKARAPEPAFGRASAPGQLPDFGLPASPVFDPAVGFDAGGGFALPGAPFDAPGADLGFDLPDPGFAMPAEPEGPDVDALVAEAVAKAQAELAETLEADFARRAEAERAAHEAELQRLQGEIGDKAGEAIAAQLTALEQRLTAYTADVVARLLGPVLTQDVQDRAIAGLSAIVTEAIRDSGAVRIRVRGPQSLFEALEARLGEHSGRIEFTHIDGFDLEVAIDESLYETKLAEWSKALSEAVP